jgi:hypothetical protein
MVEVSFVLAQYICQMALVQNDDLIETFLPYRAYAVGSKNPTLGVRLPVLPKNRIHADISGLCNALIIVKDAAQYMPTSNRSV